MQRVEGSNNLCSVEYSSALSQVPRRTQVSEELSSRDVLHEHEEVRAVLERLVELDYEARVQTEEDRLLRVHVLHLVQAHDVVLSHDLQGEVHACPRVLHEIHNAKSPRPQKANDLQVLEAILAGAALSLFAAGMSVLQLSSHPALCQTLLGRRHGHAELDAP